jgi:hypothetical protein
MLFDLNRMHCPQVIAWTVIAAAYGVLEIGISRHGKASMKKTYCIAPWIY